MSKNQTYKAPKLVTLGRVADLTQVGLTTSGADAKSGSVMHSEGK